MNRLESQLFDLEELLVMSDGIADDGIYSTIVGIANDVSELEDKDAKLRELVSILSVINKNMSKCSVTDCNQCPVSNECSESVHLEGLLGIDTKEISWRVQWRNEDSSDTQTENAKLRELIVDVHEALCADKAGICHKLILASMEDDMRDLGIEVSE